jgi:hypothetical protein
MIVKLMESLLYVVFLVSFLLILYVNREQLKKHYVYKLKTTVKVIIFTSALIINFVILTVLSVTDVHWLFYNFYHAFSSAQIVFLLISTFWGNKKRK